MGLLMDLVAGNSREVLLALALDDVDALDDRARFRAHLSLGGTLDPTWLDLFSEAVREICHSNEPLDFIEARHELGGASAVGERTIERVDRSWIEAIAIVPDRQVDPIAGRWIELLEDDLGDLPREEKPWIRDLAGEIVAFARAALDAPTILLAWSL
jgi:hypothetical protein